VKKKSNTNKFRRKLDLLNSLQSSEEGEIITASTTFLYRTRCKYCLSTPTLSRQMFQQTKMKWKDPIFARQMTSRWRQFIRRFVSEIPSNYQPFWLTKVNASFAFTLYDKSYVPTLWYKRGVVSFDFNEAFYCKCQRTFWVSHTLATQFCPDIVQRHARYAYPLLKK
jgi:hypothetical protein